MFFFFCFFFLPKLADLIWTAAQYFPDNSVDLSLSFDFTKNKRACFVCVSQRLPQCECNVRMGECPEELLKVGYLFVFPT